METKIKFDNINFQTPIWCCEYMTSLVPNICHSVLEPTAGSGNLATTLQKRFQDVVKPDDFWEMKHQRFDAVCMNPPFSPMKLGYKILDECMIMSDHIIALMPWLVLINSEKRTKLLKEFGMKSVTHLPRKTFAGSRVQCCILELEKGWRGETQFKFIGSNLCLI